MINKQPNPELEKKLNWLAYIVSFLVIFLVVMMRKIKIDTDIDFRFLPPINASLNTLAAIFLIFAFYFIKNGQVEKHRKAIYGAMICSALFLLSYVLYHITTPDTKFGGQGTLIRTIYFFILITHVVLAAVTLPFILLTFSRAYSNSFERHRKMARWVFPLWLYVAISGPICYLMLRPYY